MMMLCIVSLQTVSEFGRFKILVWLPEDGGRPPKHVLVADII